MNKLIRCSCGCPEFNVLTTPRCIVLRCCNISCSQKRKIYIGKVEKPTLDPQSEIAVANVYGGQQAKITDDQKDDKRSSGKQNVTE